MEHIRVSPSGKKTGVIDEWLAPPLRIAKQFTRISPLKILAMPIDVPDYQISMVWSPVHDKDPSHCWLRDQVRIIARSISEKTF